MKHFNNIYIFRPGALGDILIASPLFYSLKLQFPNSKLILISEQGTRLNHVTAKMVIDLIPEIDSTILYPNVSVFKKFLFFRKNINYLDNNALVYLNYSRCTSLHVLRDYLFFKAIGFKNTYSFWNYIKNSSISKKKFIPEFQRLFNITTDLTGTNKLPVDFILNSTDVTKKNSFKIFSAPFGKAKSKRWPIERYEKLYNELGALGYEIIICGSKDEEKEFTEIGWSHKSYIKGLFGLQFIELVENIKDSIIYVGNDTGPMHLAALLKIPCIAIFSDTNRDTNWNPYGKGHEILRKEVECGNCQGEVCKLKTNKCMTEISFEEVQSKLKKRLVYNG